MQTMDGTVRDPGFGVTPARDGSLAERNRVGRDYLAAMYTEYGGDIAKMWAAYNGGPGGVNTAVSRARAAGRPNEWLLYMPKETIDYVNKNLRLAGYN